jgi:hypothetical protein
VKAEETQDAQVILADPVMGIADEPDAPRRRSRQPLTRRVEHLAVRRRVKRVHREIPPMRIFLHPVGEGHGRAPPIRRHVAAQGRDLDGDT